MKIRIALVIFGLALCLWQFGASYIAAEDIRQHGEEILFELAPVDPRELFLGDYMTLNYDFGFDRVDGRLTLDVPSDARRGAAVFTITDGVARIARFDRTDELAGDERLVRYVIEDGWRGPIAIGGNRYYFQSGTAERYEDAAYGIFRVMPDGRALLSGLADEKKRPILTVGEAPLTVATE